MKPFFTHTEITRNFGIKPHALLYWTQRGYVTPSYGQAKGRGSSRFYSLADAVQVVILNQLVDLGFNPEAGAALARVAQVFFDADMESTISQFMFHRGRDLDVPKDLDLESAEIEIVVGNSDLSQVIVQSKWLEKQGEDGILFIYNAIEQRIVESQNNKITESSMTMCFRVSEIVRKMKKKLGEQGRENE